MCNPDFNGQPRNKLTGPGYYAVSPDKPFDEETQQMRREKFGDNCYQGEELWFGPYHEKAWAESRCNHAAFDKGEWRVEYIDALEILTTV